ncbi:hypothetical protein BD309DRAFT_968059 [Dichomitus squalens]|nr:hypothetical protein BD309DRAFT_968059 [Dichomitus squalens]
MDMHLDSPVHETKCKGCEDLPAVRHRDVRTRTYHATSPGPSKGRTFMLRRIYAVNMPERVRYSQGRTSPIGGDEESTAGGDGSPDERVVKNRMRSA